MVCRISSVTQAGLGEGSPLSGLLLVRFAVGLFVSGGVSPSCVSGRAPGQCEIRCDGWCRGGSFRGAFLARPIKVPP